MFSNPVFILLVIVPCVTALDWMTNSKQGKQSYANQITHEYLTSKKSPCTNSCCVCGLAVKSNHDLAVFAGWITDTPTQTHTQCMKMRCTNLISTSINNGLA